MRESGRWSNRWARERTGVTEREREIERGVGGGSSLANRIIVVKAYRQRWALLLISNPHLEKKSFICQWQVSSCDLRGRQKPSANRLQSVFTVPRLVVKLRQSICTPRDCNKLSFGSFEILLINKQINIMTYNLMAKCKIKTNLR